MSKGQIHRISISPELGQKKTNIASAVLDPELGIIGDAHGSTWRQVSLLPLESFVKVAHPDLVVKPGDFAENITTQDLDFSQIRVGARLQVGESARLEIVQIGKECHHGCVIRQTVGDCIMPREGVFARVLAGGRVSLGDEIIIESSP